eukprot:m.41576 g.41576  ORF g.41576 m.41576 type:complete len:67 (+) comp10582_c0_seq1:1747-1947(+)
MHALLVRISPRVQTLPQQFLRELERSCVFYSFAKPVVLTGVTFLDKARVSASVSECFMSMLYVHMC